MKLLTIIVNFITSSFSGIATQIFLKKTGDSNNPQVKVEKSSKTQVRKNRISGNIEIRGSENTTIEDNDIIK